MGRGVTSCEVGDRYAGYGGKREVCQSGRLGRSRKPLWSLRPPWVRIPPSPQVGRSSKQRKLHIIASLNRLVIWSLPTEGLRQRSLSSRWAISLLRCITLIIYTPMLSSRYCGTSAARFRHRYSLVPYLPLCHSYPFAPPFVLSKIVYRHQGASHCYRLMNLKAATRIIDE
jgi:hypothetical protein